MLAPGNLAGRRYQLFLLRFSMPGKDLPRNLSRGSASSANERGGGGARSRDPQSAA